MFCIITFMEDNYCTVVLETIIHGTIVQAYKETFMVWRPLSCFSPVLFGNVNGWRLLSWFIGKKFIERTTATLIQGGTDFRLETKLPVQ